MGQFTIVVPDKDMIIAITEKAAGSTGGVAPQKVLDIMWEFLDEITDEDPLPENPEVSDRLKRRMERLALPNPVFAPFSEWRDRVDGKRYKITEGFFSFEDSMAIFMGGGKLPDGITEFTFRFSSYSCTMDYVKGGERVRLNIALDGSRTRNIIGNGASTIALMSGWWESEDTFTVAARWIETCNERIFRFKFNGNGVTIEPGMAGGFMFGRKPDPIRAVHGN